ncbi:MAG: hypothetical protein UR66_C0016G0026 [Candidatus Moranbacteria bacterium GW2011_GWE1_35_17]|nr:MAG: hypothetical protein UR66_C0016G0026 [Candidatus Moranbacteria bacterium GW2011_GWE1_35_17]KKP68548.1 MAG: hypothetical protein UR65_C0058G0003 [Candidatus Moranbacteria bacterium GW2011_GWE2_35_164]KKP81988.1 MAG: hypothetical protein UR83_C0061G0003 [Candidatus Moranbacteria bacterium GW2011_GWF2_35_54]KKP82477.1 MAG: hypothetical protein UR82_C0038G0003 [Candidatus Moranbacteria bacterium GW2011_GWF1_35_5]
MRFDLGALNMTEIDVVLPKADKPQSYNTKMSLVDETGKVISNSVSFHYVLRGESSTIQNVSLDKDSYLKGEQAKIMFFWSGSSDDFPGSRAEEKKTATNFLLTITNAKGESCINPIKRSLEKDNPFVNLTENIIKDCADPKVFASVENDQGEALDKLEYDLVFEKKNEAIGNKVFNLKWILAGFFAVIVIFTIFSVLLKGKRGVRLWSLFFLMGSMFLITDNFASAVTACNRQMCANASINKGTYSPGENISTTASVAGNHTCGNYWYDGNYYGGVGSASTNMGSFHIKGWTTYVANFSLISSAPSPAGSYNMIYQVNATQTCVNDDSNEDDCNSKSNNIGPMSVPFSVSAPIDAPIDAPSAPSCSIKYSPSSMAINTTGNVTLSMNNDANNQASCNCTGLDSDMGNFNLSAETYTQGPFASAGKKDCTCTVANGSSSNTCSGSLTVTATPIIIAPPPIVIPPPIVLPEHDCIGGWPSAPFGVIHSCPYDYNTDEDLVWLDVGVNLKRGCTDSRKCEYYNLCLGEVPAGYTVCSRSSADIYLYADIVQGQWHETDVCPNEIPGDYPRRPLLINEWSWSNDTRCTYVKSDYLCRVENDSEHGIRPRGVKCPGDGVGARSPGYPWQKVDSIDDCTEERCEYYVPPPACQNSIPNGFKPCPGDGEGNGVWAYTNNCTTGKGCEYHADSCPPSCTNWSACSPSCGPTSKRTRDCTDASCDVTTETDTAACTDSCPVTSEWREVNP